ncbi:hypothetical protein CesoFtcFv8_011966 [Champsocephalus esox]|uniref:Uncharacterized protein n=1 Tax=Champsocephalus esox TaxID=159716 RepID=A0AAN8GXT9_9TELE|nr:hypothetical protein CesoFtcFv8_011966 [Champsocephalus esox]
MHLYSLRFGEAQHPSSSSDPEHHHQSERKARTCPPHETHRFKAVRPYPRASAPPPAPSCRVACPGCPPPSRCEALFPGLVSRYLPVSPVYSPVYLLRVPSAPSIRSASPLLGCCVSM